MIVNNCPWQRMPLHRHAAWRSGGEHAAAIDVLVQAPNRQHVQVHCQKEQDEA